MPTSAINPDSLHHQTSGFPRRPFHRGFTLVELLVVLAIGAMLIGLVPVAFDRMRDGSQYRDTVRAMVTELRHARQLAVSHGQAVVFKVDVLSRQYGIQGQPLKTLPASLEVKTTSGSAEPTNPQTQAEFVFLPEGGSTGGTIELVRQSGGGVRLRVDWLFGQITQEPRTL